MADIIEFYKRSNCQSNLVPGVLSRRKGENPGNAVVAITRTIPRDWNPASRNNVQTNWSHQSPSDQSLSNCHGKLDKHFTPKLYVCWILHGIKWLCLETFLSTFFSLLFLASSFPQLQRRWSYIVISALHSIMDAASAKIVVQSRATWRLSIIR